MELFSGRGHDGMRRVRNPPNTFFSWKRAIEPELI